MTAPEAPVSSVDATRALVTDLDETTSPELPCLAQAFELVHCIGRGKTGAVWRARHPRVGRDVAIKLLSHTVTDGEAREHLEREARVTARIASDAVAHVYDVASGPTGRPYLVMQLIEGRTLATLLAPGRPLGFARTMRLLKPIARALDEIHASSVAHRDLKPEDVFVVRGTSGATRIRIVDFGDAAVVKGDAATSVGVRGDLAAFAEIAYRCITGTRPSYERLALPSHFDESLPRAVDDVVASALAPDAHARFACASDLVDALARSAPVARVAPTLAAGAKGPVPPLPDAVAPPLLAEPKARANRAQNAAKAIAVLLVAMLVGGAAARLAGPSRGAVTSLSSAARR